MTSSVETLTPTRVKLTVEVTPEELAPLLKQAYKAISDQVNIPGFRRGKVPPAIIDQRFGKGVALEEAANQAIPDAIEKAVLEHELAAITQPEVDVKEITAEKGIVFEAEVDVRPEFDLPEYDEITVEVAKAEIAEEDVDEQLKALRTRFGTLQDVERAANDGDLLVLDISGTLDGEELAELKADAISYELGTEGLLPGADEALAGVEPGEERTFDFEPEVGEYEGKTIAVTVKVETVRERELPEADDDFAQLASEFDTIEELRADIEQRLARAKLSEQAHEARHKIREQVIDALDIPLPENVIEQQVEDHFQTDHGDENHRTEFEAELRANMKAQFVLDRIAEAEEVEVEEAELSQWLVQEASRYNMAPDQFANELVQSGQVQAAVGEVRRGKAMALLVSKATVTDDAGQALDFSEVLPS